MGLYAQFVRLSGGTSGTQTFGQMGIAIFDDVTNLPTNGNNCEVTYQQNINGVVTTASAIIPGLTYPVYSGLLQDTNPASPYNTSFTIISLVPGSPPVNPAQDDLTIVNVITNPESATGAHDGSLTINATSSFPLIQYSLDNITWQNSNLFTGRSSGAGTAYVKDANGGLVSAPYTIGLIGNILVSDPTVDLGNGNLSRWNAAFNPIFFIYQRKDFQITGIVNSGGNIQVNVNGDMSNVTVRSIIISSVPGQPNTTSKGDFVYIKTQYYAGSYEVISKTTGSLVLACAFTRTDTTGYININSLRPSYNIQTVITFVDPITGSFNTITCKSSPFPDGSCKADISNFLQSLLRAKDLGNYSLLNYRDMQLSASYTISYAEVWNGNTPQWVNITRPYYVLFAARQLQQLGGGNMQEFLPYPLSFQPAKWITDFINPVYSNGFPFDLSFIFSEYMVGLAPFYHIVLLDINKNPITSQTVNDAFLLNEDGGFQLNQDGSKFIIADQAIVDTPIVEHVGLNRLLINFNPPNACSFFSIQLKYTSGGNTYNLTQAVICRVDSNTPDRSVYLRWLGLTGSWNYYRFVYNQSVSLEVSNSVKIKNYVTDWANADTIEDIVAKNAGKKMTVYAENVSVDDINGLEGLKYSPKIQMLMSNTPTWQTIDTGTGNYNEYETMLDQGSFSITFALPSINIQRQ